MLAVQCCPAAKFECYLAKWAFLFCREPMWAPETFHISTCETSTSPDDVATGTSDAKHVHHSYPEIWKWRPGFNFFRCTAFNCLFFPRLFGEEGTWEDRKGIPHLPCTNSINEMHISRPCIIIILVEYEAVPSVLSQFYFHRRLVEEQKWLMDHSSAYDPETSKSCDIIGTVTYNARALVYTYTLIIELIRST